MSVKEKLVKMALFSGFGVELPPYLAFTTI